MNKKMTIGISLIAIGIIIMAILGAIGNKLIQEARTEMATKNKEDIIEHQDAIKDSILDNNDSNTKEILDETKSLKQGQKEIKSTINKVADKPNVVIRDSPNSNVQITKDGHNTINQNKTIDAKNSPGSINTIDHQGDLNVTQKTVNTEIKADEVHIHQEKGPRKLSESRAEKIINRIAQELKTNNLNKSSRIIVQYPTVASDGRSFGSQIYEYLKSQGFTNLHLQSGMSSGEDEVKFNYSSTKTGVWVIVPIRGK